jgi:hypothetical protein
MLCGRNDTYFVTLYDGGTIMSRAAIPSLAAYHELVGRVAGSWASLDLNLDVTIAQLTGLNAYESFCVTAQFGSHYPKMKAIIALCEHKGISKKTLKKLKTFQGKLSDTSGHRNRAIHDAWVVKEGGEVVEHFSILDQPKTGSDPIDELISVLNSINSRIDSFRRLRMEVLNELRSSSNSLP